MYHYANEYTVALLAAVLFFAYRQITDPRQSHTTDALVAGTLVFLSINLLSYATYRKVEQLTSAFIVT